MMKLLTHWFCSATSNNLRGGLALQRNKVAVNTGEAIKTLRVPKTLCIPLLNYRHEVVEPVVTVGQSVQIGDTLGTGVIASCHGVITSIETRTVNHPSGIESLCVILSTETNSSADDTAYPIQETLTTKRIAECSIQGLGGAGFKTADKLQATHDSQLGVVDTLIINAVECEPLISCDEALMINQAPAIITAIEGLIDLTQCRRCLFAIEDDKSIAIEQLVKAVQNHTSKVRFDIVYLAPIYPSGAERPLVERLTGKHLPGHVFPVSLGILCINVATALATEQARLGIPMVTRIITIAGELADNPMNVRVTFGTSVFDVIKQTDNLAHIDSARVRLGGPLSGFLINDLHTPITATSNCITLERPAKSDAVHACIRCGACSDVCPVDLLPQQLHNFCKTENTEKAKAFRLDECIECACCDVVCPSNIPLTQTFRFAKGLIREQDRQALLATQAETRFQQRESRLEEREKKRALKREEARARLATNADPIADALARAKRRRKKP